MQASDSPIDIESIGTDRVTTAETHHELLPGQLNSPVAKLVYLYLSAVGPASADELATALRLRKLTVYPVLDHLSSNNLLSKHGRVYRI